MIDVKRTLLFSAATLVLAACAYADKAEPKPAFGPSAVDSMIRAEWKKQGVAPAPPVDDARFLRRVYLDIAGTIPTPDAVKAFMADRSPDKRAKAVDALLASPKYADEWTSYWDAALIGRGPVKNALMDRVAWKEWLHDEFAQNAPWNRFVYDLITATGVNSTGGSYARIAGFKSPADRQMEAQATQDSASDGFLNGTGKVNGAVNWFTKFQNNVADMSGQASKLFLGVQIQCAQCHDHKTEKWKQEDFRKFTACFVATRARPVGDMENGRMRRVELFDVPRMPRRQPMQRKNDNTAYIVATPTAIDGTDFSDSSNRRAALAQWMTAPENPWFAEAIVNRMWSHFMGRGFVEPIDDFRPSNPAVMPDLMKKLADDFVAHDYDLKHLIRTITATKVYQLSSQPAVKADSENKLWARYRLKPMGPDELMDSLVTATDLGTVLERMSGGNLDNLKALIARQFTFLFDVDEEFEQKDFEGTIPQALLLLNSNITNRSVTPIPGTALAQVLTTPGGDKEKIESLYLRTVSRMPTAQETAKWTQFVNAPRDVVLNGEQAAPQGPMNRRAAMRERRQMMAQLAAGQKRNGGPDPLARFANRMNVAATDPKTQAYEDLFWALLNSSEFMFNH
jgi:hypothetical protein